jgi:valyl-tRNA synthetase
MLREMPKAYEPQAVEDAIYAAWEKSGFFRPENLPDLVSRKEAFTIVLPPPNVTGTLHMGHAAMLAIEDIMIRFARMRGKRALWIPGTDHAAIATQAKVEKLLMSEGVKDPRGELGREKFLERVQQFAAESHDIIVNQVRKMGASIDWSREAYTLDEARHRAVHAVFKMMYDDGLIYRGDRVINWCPHCASTLADDEVEHKETTATFYTFRYDKNFPMRISSTRPETKLGDTAVAVHPSDDRYQAFVGQSIEAEFAGKKLTIRVVADEGVDPSFGTGALGVTPSHSQMDAEIAVKNDLPFMTVINEEGKMTTEAGAGFEGLDVKTAREKVVEWLRLERLIEKEEEVAQNLSICYRCGSTVEPLPKLQWFINVNKPFTFRASLHAPIEGLKDGQEVTLKSLMQHVVRSEQIKIMPDRFEKTYFHWIDNLRDWCISRQIWFGHRVPVWYRQGTKGAEGTRLRPTGATDGQTTGTEEIVVGEAPVGEGWKQDPDTLDTWFSSGLWTFSTLGWPAQTEDLKMYHPTSVLETGYDIIFQWVARMILMTTYAVGEVPFKTVYLHGLVRDEQGRKMSKSLGNIIDPLDMISKYGADATRLSLVIGSTPGNDTKLSEEKVAGYRNFANKLWNIARFVLKVTSPPPAGGGGGGDGRSAGGVEAPEPQTLADRWILGRLAEVSRDVTERLERHELSAAGELLRDFTWADFADWYLEMAKVQKGRETIRTEGTTDGILLFILENVLVLWHPFMPFVTEEIWQSFGQGDRMIVHPWPKIQRVVKLVPEIQLIQDVVISIRHIRAQYKVEPSRHVDVLLVSETNQRLFDEQADVIRRLARVGVLTTRPSGEKPDGSASAVVGSVQIYIPLAGLVDTAKEKTRLTKQLKETKAYLTNVEAKLANKAFIAKAPSKIVDELNIKFAEAKEKAASLERQLATL